MESFDWLNELSAVNRSRGTTLILTDAHRTIPPWAEWTPSISKMSPPLQAGFRREQMERWAGGRMF